MNRVLSLIAAIVLAVMSPTTTFSRTWVVAQDGSGDFALISEAFGATVSGDTVLVRPGEYREEPYVDCGPPLGASFKSLSIGGSPGDPADVVLIMKLRFYECPRTTIRDVTFRGVSTPLEIDSGMEQKEAELHNCVFEDNGTCPIGGAALSINYTNVLVEDCVFRRNSTNSAEGAAICGGNYLTVRSCVFEDNVSAGEGGAIQASNMTVEDCIFVRNKSPRGAAIFTRAAIIRNCSFWDNEGGTTISLTGLDYCSMDHSIIAGTRNGMGVEVYGVVTCCAFWDNEQGNCWLCSGPGNFEADPQFCDPEHGDFGLQVGSPCLEGTTGGEPCGLIGAKGVGCGESPVLRLSWGRLKAMFR